MPSKVQHIFDLPPKTPIYMGRQDFVVAYARGKSVLHLGCVDTGFSQEKFEAGLFLHARLHNVTKKLWGVDIDRAGLDWMRSQGWQNLYELDIEHLDAEPRIISEPFELLVLTEVIEHLDNPGRFLEALRPMFHAQTELLVTTPNATSLGNIITNLRHTETVHPDHNFWFSYHTLRGLLNKYGYQIRQVALYSQYDYTHPWLGKYLPTPAQVDLSIEPTMQTNHIRGENRHKKYHNPNLLGWIKANTQAMFYGFVLKRWPFFADGLIVIVGLGN